MDNGEPMQDAATGAAATPDQPVRAAERLVSLDFIRGIAVLGILFPNIVAYGNPILAYFWPKAVMLANRMPSTAMPRMKSSETSRSVARTG